MPSYHPPLPPRSWFTVSSQSPQGQDIAKVGYLLHENGRDQGSLLVVTCHAVLTILAAGTSVMIQGEFLSLIMAASKLIIEDCSCAWLRTNAAEYSQTSASYDREDGVYNRPSSSVTFRTTLRAVHPRKCRVACCQATLQRHLRTRRSESRMELLEAPISSRACHCGSVWLQIVPHI